jgi:hypothetical protein
MTRKLSILSLSASFALFSCEPEVTSNPADTIAYGLISNTCGPTDGPETQVRLTDTAVTCDSFARYPQTSAYLGVASISGVSVGKDSAYTDLDAWRCDTIGGCTDQGKLRIEFRRSTATRMSGTYRIEKDGKIVATGGMELVICPDRPLCG